MKDIYDSKTTAIIGAMDIEIENFKHMMKNRKEQEVADIIFHKGSLLGKKIILLKSGIGKVNAALGTAIAVERFKADTIIFTGVAGAVNPSFEIGDIVISRDLIEHDYDVSQLKGKYPIVKNTHKGFYPADKKLINLAKKSSQRIMNKKNIHISTIATGDQFITDIKKVKWIYETFKAGAVEMEGASVAHVALMYKIPFVIIRTISDKADKSAKIDFNNFLISAAENSINIVSGMFETIRSIRI